MDWIINLFTNTESIAHIALLYAIVIAVGILLGKIKIGGISLGVTWVLFAGILAGHVGFTAPKDTMTLRSRLRTYSVRVLHRFAGRSRLL